MSAPDDPMTALNMVLSEVIDIVQEVKQAHRKVPETHALHAALDRLFDDLGAWARVLIEQDEARGISALAAMSSVAGRTPPNLWPGSATDYEVRSQATGPWAPTSRPRPCSTPIAQRSPSPTTSFARHSLDVDRRLTTVVRSAVAGVGR
jgi:hypothetical protein